MGADFLIALVLRMWAGVFFAAAAAVSSYAVNSGYAEAVGAKLATWMPL